MFEPVLSPLLAWVRRRWKLLAALPALALLAVVAHRLGDWWMERPFAPVTDHHRQGRLSARPAVPEAGKPRPAAPSLPGPGWSALGLATFRDTLLYVPATLPRDRPVGLLLWLHGYGGEGRRSARRVLRQVEQAGVLLLVPSSRQRTWDVVRSKQFGRDVAGIDAALAHVFARFAVDPDRVVIGGNSDGGSYALSLGLANGDLFSRLVAFVPGLVRDGPRVGKPPIHIAHGRADRMHPIDITARPITRTLRAAGYTVSYEELEAGHDLPPEAAARALAGL